MEMLQMKGIFTLCIASNSNEETVWIAASPWHISQNVILQSGMNVNGGVRRDMCLIGNFCRLLARNIPIVDTLSGHRADCSTLFA